MVAHPRVDRAEEADHGDEVEARAEEEHMVVPARFSHDLVPRVYAREDSGPGENLGQLD